MKKLPLVIDIFLILAFLCTLSFSIYFALKAFQYDTQVTEATRLKHPQYHLVVVPEELNNPYWQLVKEGAKAAGAKYGAAIEFNGPIQTNINEHNKIIEAAIASKVDGIITQGMEFESNDNTINQAIEKGIPVLTVDTDDPKSKRVGYVGTNNFKAGEIAGIAMAEATGGHANIGIITGSFTSGNQKERVAGFKNAIKDYPGMKILEIESSQISQIQAAEETYNIFLKHPDVNAFFGTSALDGLGISAIVEQYHKKDDIYVMAFDTLPDTMKLIKAGQIDATVVQEPYAMGYQAVKSMVDVINGRKIKKVNFTDTDVIYKKDLPYLTHRKVSGVAAP